jgi:hypothetical protein
VIDLFIQPHKCVAWSFFGLPLDFNPPFEGIRVLKVSLGTLIFTSSLIKYAFLKDVQHVDLFLKMGDFQVIFRIIIHFMQCPSYLLRCIPPSSNFTKSFISFDFSLLQMFGCFLGPRSFDSLEGPITHKQLCLPITFGGIGLISTSTITPTTYLKS